MGKTKPYKQKRIFKVYANDMGNYNDKFEKASGFGEITIMEENKSLYEIPGTGVK